MRKILTGLLVLCSLAGLVQAKEDVAKNFVTPPESARIWVYWFWLNGNLTREGMTADLEAMKRAGVGGVLIMEVDQGAPVGPVAFMSDKWRELFKHMVKEADRLGIEVNMNNDAGWNGSGGPWVPLDKAMQVVVTSEKQVPAGKKFEGELPKPQDKGGFYRDIAVLAFPTPADSTNLSFRIRNLHSKNMSWGGMHGYSIDVSTGSNVPPESVVARDKIVDLTSKMDAKGSLAWDAPVLGAGTANVQQEWTVVRFGHTFTGAKSHPAPATGAGPECDKLSKEGIEANYNGMIGKLVKDVGSLAGKSFTATHVDSWEVGSQNWTPKMRREFKKRRGYDMMPFMPVLTGRVVDSLEISERFLRDVRQTVSDLLAENYIGHLRKLANKDGLRLTMETYTTPANDLDVANYVEEPICEFWWPNGGGFYWCVKSMASVAHVNGRSIVGAEAFTADGKEKWLAHPAVIKALGDRAFCDGVNRFIVHRYAMQPWVDDRRPGMTMGPWGLHYERTQTWWEYSKAWHQYVARCQYLLRQGTFVADVLALQSEEPMQRFNPLSLNGYDYDAISPQAFMKNVTVKKGLIKLPSGMTYRLLVLPEGEYMSPEMLDKIEDLVEDGATIIGKPPVKAAGLSGYPKSDAEILETVKELWGSIPPSESGDRKVGKGRVVWGKAPSEVLAGMGVMPDCTASPPMRYIHRAADDMNIYFVSNQQPEPVDAVCTFRVSGKPELWDPVTGEQRALPKYEQKDGCTVVPLEFEPSGSMFVVFRRRAEGVLECGGLTPLSVSGSAKAVSSDRTPKSSVSGTQQNFPKFAQVQEVTGAWNVQFDSRWGGPADPVAFDKLEDWAKKPEDAIKYYSGTALYRKVLDVPQSAIGNRNSKLYLDLGKVAVMAELKLNGRELGILWKAPYRVEITDAVRAGSNDLEIKVVNLWINRMVGDELLPEDSERNDNGTLKKWPEWLQEGKPSPAGRFTFTSWRLWKKGAALQESGLLGPVTLQSVVVQ